MRPNLKGKNYCLTNYNHERIGKKDVAISVTYLEVLSAQISKSECTILWTYLFFYYCRETVDAPCCWVGTSASWEGEEAGACSHINCWTFQIFQGWQKEEIDSILWMLIRISLLTPNSLYVSNFLKGLNQSSCNILIGLASWSGLLGKFSFSLCSKVKPTTTKLAGLNLSAQLCCYFYFWPSKTLAVICNLLEMWNISRIFLGLDQLVTNKFI